MTKAIEDAIDEISNVDKKIEKFSDLLDALENTEDKKKMLWKEVYENALSDRECANVLFTDLLIQSKGNSANHTVFGPIMAKYLERMSKSNEQILKLAELVAKEEKSEVSIDDIYDKING